MDDSIGLDWLLLIHRLPPKPDYLRVKVRRRLERVGALPVKSSVYVLPLRDDTLEDFQWIASEIAADGGEATICGATFLAGTNAEEVRSAFIAARDSEYGAIAAAAREVGPGGDAALARLTKHLSAVRAQDWFDAPGRVAAEAALRAAEGRLRGPSTPSPAPGDVADAPPKGRTWVTRAGVFVDRMASAWLIRRFIDPGASFAFVETVRHSPGPGEVRFDMFEGEYTHEGDRCTFEVLLDRFHLRDDALGTIGEIVHDIDLKDERYGRPETPGVAAVLAGIAATTRDDADRLTRGAALFDSLYATLGGSQ